MIRHEGMPRGAPPRDLALQLGCAVLTAHKHTCVLYRPRVDGEGLKIYSREKDQRSNVFTPRKVIEMITNVRCWRHCMTLTTPPLSQGPERDAITNKIVRPSQRGKR